jgi:hypothetical protein
MPYNLHSICSPSDCRFRFRNPKNWLCLYLTVSESLNSKINRVSLLPSYFTIRSDMDAKCCHTELKKEIIPLVV